MTIDGNLSESEWRNAKELDNFLTVFPNDKSNPKYKTKIKNKMSNYKTLKMLFHFNL